MPRLSILTKEEQRKFDSPPDWNTTNRALHFVLTAQLQKKINQLHTSVNKVGFLIQYAYFKATQRFFPVSRFRQEDIEYAANILGIPKETINIDQYKKKTPIYHQVIIRSWFNYQLFDKEKQTWLSKEVQQRTYQMIYPRQLFDEILWLLEKHCIEKPSYHYLSELITKHYINNENQLLKTLKQHITTEQMEILKKLLVADEPKKSSFLNQCKIKNQSIKPKAIKASLSLFNQIKAIIIPLQPLINHLAISPACIQYYATWVKKAKFSQLKQLDDHHAFLRLIAFLQHQYYMRQDSFIDIFLRCVRSTENTAKNALMETEQLTRNDRREAVRHLTKKHRCYKTLIDEITEVVKCQVLNDAQKIKHINELLEQAGQEENEEEQKKIVLFESSLDRIAKDKDYFDMLESLSKKLSLRISGILIALTFNEGNSNHMLLKAIHYYQQQVGKITDTAPIEFLSSIEKEAVSPENGEFKPALYRILLYLNIARAIKSGKLNLQYTYRYLAIEDYLIDKETWETNRKKLLTDLGLDDLSDCNKVIARLKDLLDEKYHQVNQNNANKKNPYLKITPDKKNKFTLSTPALEQKETRHITALLEQSGYVSILDILKQINHVTQFTSLFTHHNIKYQKKRPAEQVFIAGILGLGCNIGVTKMAQISAGINQNTIINTVNWYFTMKTLNAANQRIREFINQLALPHFFITDKNQKHASSDGQKFGVSVESLMANYSFKYFGKDKGISVYTFIDERNVLFHHNVLSSTEREATYVIDGLNNLEGYKIDIHSSDTHGYTELIFATTHLLHMTFAPRLKNIGRQAIYTLNSKNEYENKGYSLLPSRSINRKHIKEVWDDILRFVATIKSKKTSASQLFKRLSSYTKDHPLYKGIKEFGRIIKSIFILTYVDDMVLRQRIEKQLNRIESSNKFAKAIFYANSAEFRQAEPEEQNITVACKVLIQNCIVLWNYLYLSEILANCKNDMEREEILSLIRLGSILVWSHINLHGEFDFNRMAANDQVFDMNKILSLQLLKNIKNA